MKKLLMLLLTVYLFGLSFSARRHNTNGKMTKILEKIRPNSELCNEDNCPTDRGTCSGENYCYCFEGYISTFEKPYFCDYGQKDRTLYFLLEFVLSFGIGHLYAGHYFYGIIKLICYGSIFGLYLTKYSKKKGIDAARTRLFLWVIITIWQFIDGYCIFKGIYPDGNGRESGFKYF